MRPACPSKSRSGTPKIFSAKLTDTDKFQWTSKSDVGASTGQDESAAFSIGGPAFGYAGPTTVLIYWDTVYHSFMFAFPTEAPSAQGVLTDPAGKVMAAKPVSIAVGSVKYNTVTDAKGRFAFYGLPEGAAQVGVGSQSFSLTAGPGGKTAKIRTTAP